MTAVTSIIARARRAPEALVTVVLCGATAWCGFLVVRADGRAPRHSLARDPISWFASDEAPDPGRLRFGLVVVGVALVVLAFVGVAKRRTRAAVLVAAVAGGLVVGISAAPLDCSIRFDYCEKLVAAGFASDAHLVHVALSAALVVLAAFAAALDLRRTRAFGSAAVALVVVAASVAMIAAPTSQWLGTFQLLALAGGASAIVRLWRSAPTLVSPP